MAGKKWGKQTGRNSTFLQGDNPALPRGVGPRRGNSRVFFQHMFGVFSRRLPERNVYEANFATLSENAPTEKPSSEKPVSEKPVTEKPVSENRS